MRGFISGTCSNSKLMVGARYTVPLSRVDSGDFQRVGGKAANLGKLHRNGFNVPSGFVVSTEAYTEFLAHNELDAGILDDLEGVDDSEPVRLDEACTLIRSRITGSMFPEEVSREIAEGYAGLGAVAVRSSATAEDLEDASFAGQMETFLNVVGEESVLEHVKRCYASLWTGRAVSYRRRAGVPDQSAEIAVVVQRMVPARAAGVMFTVNPVGDAGTVLIESNYGVGESVVSGEAAPDKFLVDRDTVTVTSMEVAAKTVAAFPVEGGGVSYVPVDEERVDEPSLSLEEINTLTVLGVSVEECFASPQDVEWAVDESGVFHVLQSRPITTLQDDEGDGITWTRGYSDDYWNDNVTPLFFELLGDHLVEYVNVELNKIMGYFDPGDAVTDRLLRLHKSHAYFNLEILKRKVMYEIPGFLRNDDVLNYFPEGDGPYGKETMRRLPFSVAKRLRAELRVRSMDPDGSSSRTADMYDKWISEEFNPFYDAHAGRMKALADSSLGDLMLYAGEVNDVMVGHYRLVRYGIPVHNIGMNLLSQYLLKRFLGEEDAKKAYPILVSGLDHRTSDTNRMIMNLASTIRDDPELRRTVLETMSTELLPTLKQMNTPESEEFLKSFDEFSQVYGVRGFTREPYYPRWGEAPEYVFDILKSLVVDEGNDLEAVDERNRALKAETEELVQERVNRLSLGGAKWRLLSGVLNTARRYIVFREEQRFVLDQWITMNRELYLKVGSRLVEAGALDTPGDVFYLWKHEISALVDGEPLDVRRSVALRREEFNRYENMTPPKFLEGNREFNDPCPPSSHVVEGIPASQGVLTGTVRVLTSIADIWKVRAGEILVVPRTDPGWTPVFSKIGGLVTETGGILSHGAVVSREYGVPAVTNIRNACRLFRTGQTVTIDGATGSVTMED